jgi:hypothetical protein
MGMNGSRLAVNVEGSGGLRKERIINDQRFDRVEGTKGRISDCNKGIEPG